MLGALSDWILVADFNRVIFFLTNFSLESTATFEILPLEADKDITISGQLKGLEKSISSNDA